MQELFNSLRNMHGQLNVGLRVRLQAVLDNPCAKTWDDTYSIIVSCGSRSDLTLWQAVLAVDPSFPRTGPRTDKHGKVLKGWSRVPDRDLLLKALLLASKAMRQ